MGNGKYTVENVTENLTLSVEGTTATTLQKTQINFYVGSTLYASKSYTPGETITLPTAPTKQGYTFTGWEADLYEQAFSCIDVPFPETMPGCSFNAYAVFEKPKPRKPLAALTATAELTELEAYIQSLETADATGIAGCRKDLLGFSYGDKNYDYYHDGVLDIRDLVRLKKIALMMYYEPIDDELPLDWD